MTDTDVLEFLEKVARKSQTGVSLDFVPPGYGMPSGYRFMRRFWIGDPAKTIREAVIQQQHLFDDAGNLRAGHNR